MTSDYRRVEAAIRHIDSNLTEQPDLESIAAAAGVSVAHCVRLFRRWAGVSPKRFMQYLTLERAKSALEDSASVLEAALESGLSGPSRLHDHFVKIEAMTPGEYKSGGAALDIRYGRHASPFGEMLLAITRRGICGLAFCEPGGVPREIERLRRKWPNATLTAAPQETSALARRLLQHSGEPEPLSLLVSGTNFQLRTWEALLRVPPATVCSYGQLARLAGHAGSARATGAAVGANQIAWLIPCHRVIRSTGGWGDYRWGAVRKRAMLGWEAAHASIGTATGAAAL